MDPPDSRDINFCYKAYRMNALVTSSSWGIYEEPLVLNDQALCAYCLEKPYLFLYKNEKICRSCLMEETNKLLKK